MTLDDMIAKQAGKPTKAELEEMAKRQREASGIMTREEQALPDIRNPGNRFS